MWFKTIKNIYKINYDGLFNYRRIDRFVKILKLVKKSNPKRILDVGCGAGSYCIYLHNDGYDIKGIDKNKSLIKTAKAFNSDIDFNVGDIQKINLNKKFNLVIFSTVIEYIKDHKKAMNNLHKLISKNGHLIISTPTDHWQKNCAKYDTYAKFISEKDLISLVSSKFEITDIVYSGNFIGTFLRSLESKKMSCKKISEFRRNKSFIFYKFIAFPVLSFLMFIDDLLPKRWWKRHMIVLAKKRGLTK